MTGVDGHMTGSGTHVTGTGHAGPCDGQINASALVETANGHSESVSAPDEPGSGPKTATRIAKTAHGQKGSEMSRCESASVHETTNGPWNRSANRETCHTTSQTTNGHNDVLHGTLDLERERTGKSESGRGPR